MNQISPMAQRWMNEFAYKVKNCPRCHLKCFCLIFESGISGEEWECAECGFNPHCSCDNCR